MNQQIWRASPKNYEFKLRCPPQTLLSSKVCRLTFIVHRRTWTRRLEINPHDPAYTRSSDRHLNFGSDSFTVFR